MLRMVLNCFLFTPQQFYHPDNFSVPVTCVGETIYFGTLNQVPGIKVYNSPSQEKYGIPFELVSTTNEDPNMLGFFRYYRYRLLDAVNLVVRSEIDCVNEQGQYIELKTKNVWHNQPIPVSQEDYRIMWGQAYLGRADSVVIGLLHKTNPANQSAPLRQLPGVVAAGNGPTMVSTSYLRQLGQVQPLMLQRFASMLLWLREKVTVVGTYNLKYSRHNGEFTITH
jgi:hypothetical protein